MAAAARLVAAAQGAHSWRRRRRRVHAALERERQQIRQALLLRLAAASLRGGRGAVAALELEGAGLVARYSRTLEREADREGQGLAARAGFDPGGMASFLAALGRESTFRRGRPRRPTFLDTHPAAPERATDAALDYLDWLHGRFDSWYLTAAAYNAGPHRVVRWVRDFGDPRTGDIAMLDWIETIPFSETRNYVQRVLEAVPVYRRLLNDTQLAEIDAEPLTVGRRGK